MDEQITKADQSAPSSCEIVAGSEDITSEIFIRIPAHLLARCKWVSKQWLSFIINPLFIRKHTFIHLPSFTGIFLIPKQINQSHKVHFISLNQTITRLPFIDILNSRGFQIIHSCNGLLICQSEQSYYVCNPTTCQVKSLPTCSFFRNEDKFSVNLLFDALKSPHYNVVCIQKLKNRSSVYMIAIYSSETGIWSFSEDIVSGPEDFDFKNGVPCNNKIYWLKDTVNGLYLDLNTKMLRQMPVLPRREQYRFKYFGKSNDNLFYIISRPLLNYYEVYQMKEDHSGWHLKSRINLNLLVTSYPIMARNFGQDPLFSEYECDVLRVNDTGSEGGMELVLSIPGEVVIFKVGDKSSIKIQDPVFRPSDIAVWYKIYSAYDYHETLSLV